MELLIFFFIFGSALIILLADDEPKCKCKRKCKNCKCEKD